MNIERIEFSVDLNVLKIDLSPKVHLIQQFTVDNKGNILFEAIKYPEDNNTYIVSKTYETKVDEDNIYLLLNLLYEEFYFSKEDRISDKLEYWKADIYYKDDCDFMFIFADTDIIWGIRNIFKRFIDMKDWFVLY